MCVYTEKQKRDDRKFYIIGNNKRFLFFFFVLLLLFTFRFDLIKFYYLRTFIIHITIIRSLSYVCRPIYGLNNYMIRRVPFCGALLCALRHIIAIKWFIISWIYIYKKDVKYTNHTGCSADGTSIIIFFFFSLFNYYVVFFFSSVGIIYLPKWVKVIE